MDASREKSLGRARSTTPVRARLRGELEYTFQMNPGATREDARLWEDAVIQALNRHGFHSQGDQMIFEERDGPLLIRIMRATTDAGDQDPLLRDLASAAGIHEGPKLKFLIPLNGGSDLGLLQKRLLAAINSITSKAIKKTESGKPRPGGRLISRKFLIDPALPDEDAARWLNFQFHLYGNPIVSTVLTIDGDHPRALKPGAAWNYASRMHLLSDRKAPYDAKTILAINGWEDELQTAIGSDSTFLQKSSRRSVLINREPLVKTDPGFELRVLSELWERAQTQTVVPRKLRPFWDFVSFLSEVDPQTAERKLGRALRGTRIRPDTIKRAAIAYRKIENGARESLRAALEEIRQVPTEERVRWLRLLSFDVTPQIRAEVLARAAVDPVLRERARDLATQWGVMDDPGVRKALAHPVCAPLLDAFAKQ
ncbi:MAG: hypothetical protein AAB425_08225 [Bdellovibrionota bacterium]